MMQWLKDWQLDDKLSRRYSRKMHFRYLAEYRKLISVYNASRGSRNVSLDAMIDRLRKPMNDMDQESANQAELALRLNEIFIKRGVPLAIIDPRYAETAVYFMLEMTQRVIQLTPKPTSKPTPDSVNKVLDEIFNKSKFKQFIDVHSSNRCFSREQFLLFYTSRSCSDFKCLIVELQQCLSACRNTKVDQEASKPTHTPVSTGRSVG